MARHVPWLRTCLAIGQDRRLLLCPAILLGGLVSCGISTRDVPDPNAIAVVHDAAPLAEARAHARFAKARAGSAANLQWVRCAQAAFPYLASSDAHVAGEAVILANRCTTAFLSAVGPAAHWKSGKQVVAGAELELERRSLSPLLGPSFRMIVASDVAAEASLGQRHVKKGFGVPVAVIAPRCSEAPMCNLLPPSGVFRPATAWIETDPTAGTPRLVVASASEGPIDVGARRWPLAEDSSAFYAAGLKDSPIRRLSVFGLFGGRELGRRAGIYLLEDYDPNKRTLVMVHGLGSSPLAWARLSDAIWADPFLRQHYQVWQLVYRTNEPMLVARMRVQGHLDHAVALLDPEGDDLASRNLVLIGHSMGGVVSRYLTVDSGDALLNAAFLRPLAELDGPTGDREEVERIFRFKPYNGVRRAVFIAAPHEGSPTADGLLGRLTQRLVGRRTPEIRTLQRVAQQNPSAIQPTLRESYLQGRINSITTLRGSQPVMQVARSLRPAASIPYHSIAGNKPGTSPPSDGVVPVRSATLEGSTSVLVVPSEHNVHEHPEAIEEVLRILREDVAQPAR